MKNTIFALLLFSSCLIHAQVAIPVVVTFDGKKFTYNPQFDSLPVKTDGFNGLTAANFFLNHDSTLDSTWFLSGTYIIYPHGDDTWSDGKKWGLFQGKEEMLPCLYDHLFAYAPCNGENKKPDPFFREHDTVKKTLFFLAASQDKWGVLSRQGKEMIPAVYDLPFSDEAGGNCYFTQRKMTCDLGKEIDCGELMLQDGTFSYPILGRSMVFMKDGKYGLVDTTGKVVLPFAYERLIYHKEGLAELKAGKNTVWCAFNGTVLPVYGEVRLSSSGFHNVKRKGKWGYIDNSGKEVVPCSYDGEVPLERNEVLRAWQAHVVKGKYEYDVSIYDSGEVVIE
jgi:hypothetical protein